MAPLVRGQCRTPGQLQRNLQARALAHCMDRVLNNFWVHHSLNPVAELDDRHRWRRKCLHVLQAPLQHVQRVGGRLACELAGWLRAAAQAGNCAAQLCSGTLQMLAHHYSGTAAHHSSAFHSLQGSRLVMEGEARVGITKGSRTDAA
jgi:hypothetical protein